MSDEQEDFWTGFPRSWRDVVLAALVLAAFVALAFSPLGDAGCSVRISDSTTTTTTPANTEPGRQP